jgi:hypothetical protein
MWIRTYHRRAIRLHIRARIAALTETMAVSNDSMTMYHNVPVLKRDRSFFTEI